MPDGRFAPSPTGPLHLGNLRTALLAWLFARSSASRFLLRTEDLDPATARAEHEVGQRRDLTALGLDWDGDVVRQSDRRPLHDAAIAHLEAAGLTYPCYCTRREIQEAAAAPNGPVSLAPYPGTCRALDPRQRQAREAAGRSPAMRLRTDGARRGFQDRLHGWVDGVIDDVVLRRNDGTPSYNLAVVVDDGAQGVGEVVRGDDLLASTPRQLHIAGLLGLPDPRYAHVPLVLAPDGSRLAKRHGAVTLADRTSLGHSPARVLSDLAVSLRLASPGESVTVGRLLARFDPDSLPRTAWVLGEEEVAGTAARRP